MIRRMRKKKKNEDKNEKINHKKIIWWGFVNCEIWKLTHCTKNTELNQLNETNPSANEIFQSQQSMKNYLLFSQIFPFIFKPITITISTVGQLLWLLLIESIWIKTTINDMTNVIPWILNHILLNIKTISIQSIVISLIQKLSK